MLKHINILLFFVTTSLSGFTQQPSHFKLGEEELSGIDIYDILQDDNKNYWLATDNGLIKYDGYIFKHIKCNNASSNSVFDLKLDYNNILYCKNLSGQIFQIKNDSCKEYFQIPDSLMSFEIFYSFDNQNNLIISTNSIFSINEKKELLFLSKKQPNSYYADLFVLKDSSIICQHINANQFIKIKNNIAYQETIDKRASKYFFTQFYLDDKLYYYDKITSRLLIKKNSHFLINTNFNPLKSEKERLRYYSDNKRLWIARQAGGAAIYNQNLTPLFNNNTVFKNHFISAFHKDHEGNILLGTFGDGIIVIPNLNLTDINLSDINSKISRISSTSNNTIYLGTQNGQIFQFDSSNTFTPLWNKQNKNIEVLEYIEETNEILFDDKDPTFINLDSKKKITKDLRAIKDVVKIRANEYIIATNVGLSYYFPISGVSNDINGFTDRTNCVNYDTSAKTIYAGTASGLKIGNERKTTYFELNSTPLICRDILFFNEKIYVTTSKNGVLIFKNNQLIDNWKEEKNILSNTVKHIKIHKEKLYITTDKGMQILNENGESLYVLNKSSGLYTNNITDFEIQNNLLWLVHQKGVQSINLKHLIPNNYKPTISLTKILINDSNIISENNIYSYRQNKFEFQLSATSIKYPNEIKYHYQLSGIDEDWQINNYVEKSILYKTLPPGDYTFTVKSVYKTIESEPLTYQFTITQPFWNTWWFYVLSVLVFITISYLFFNQQIEKQRKKNQLQNELNASKLIAVQSQMNPHFIFNAINSIQDLILKGDIDNSYSYIIKFSKLVRQTLNFSDKEFIDIEDEIELLETYLELEKLRFKDDFEYTIRSDERDLQVPPMLVQPFIENAIKHGLLHKEGLKKLDIVFHKNEILHCVITDNGIGRKKAQEIKDRQQKNHQSFSVNATKSRFEIMKSHYKQDLGILFEDLSENGEAKGTKVVINMPFRRNY